jgi:hypothetical protein
VQSALFKKKIPCPFSVLDKTLTIYIEMGCSWFNTKTNKRKTSINNKNMH